MRLLYGSQNFGYDTDKSDKDWLEIVYPTWNDIVENKVISYEDILPDKSHIKVKDIRLLYDIILHGHFSEIQFMYSREYIDCEELQWFLENRSRLSRVNLYGSYRTNSLNMIRNLKERQDEKTLTRAYTFYQLLNNLLRVGDFELYNRNTLDFRKRAAKLGDEERKEMANVLTLKLEVLREEFIPFRNKLDDEMLDKAKAEITRLLKKNIRG